MNTVLVAALALACVLGLATAQYGYPSYGVGGGLGDGGLLMLIGLLFLLLFLFNPRNTTTSSTTSSVTYFNATTG